MKNSTLPEAKDWDHYWQLDGTTRFTKVSWSKRRIMKVLQPYVGKGKRALDAGCGSGFFSNYFCDQGMDVTALDYAQEALDIAKKMTGGRARLMQQDLLLPRLDQVTDDRYDLIFSDGLLEHFPLEDQRKIINNWVSVLVSGGVIVTFVPNRWSPWELIRPFYMPGIEETPFVLKDLLSLHTHDALALLGQGGVNTLPFMFSPDAWVGSLWGMLLYVVVRKK